ncbi:MAG: glycosyltransferase family 2 protein [Acidimicrobiales bacterium]
MSVVISTRNRTNFLPGLLDALSAQTYDKERYEVILVDDASTDGTWNVVEAAARRTDLRLLGLRLSARGGQGPGRNAGIARSRAAIIAFTDDDCIPAPGWLGALCEAFPPDLEGTRPQVVAQGRTVAWKLDEDTAGAWARTIWVVRPTWLFETCNIAYRSVDLVRAGGFPGPGDAPVAADGKLVGEDALLGWRVTGQGARLVFVPEAEVGHRHLDASYADWVLDLRGRSVFPVLVRRDRSARRALWARYFLASRTAAFDAAVVGTALSLGTRQTRWLLGALPWLWLALPEAAERKGRHPAVRLAQVGLGDLVGFQALVRSSLRERRIVL